jgi:hypothetical protein
VAGRIKKAAGKRPVSTWVTDLIEEHLDDGELKRQWEAFYRDVAPKRVDIRRADAMIERRNPTMARLAQDFFDAKTPLVTSAGVVAQVWRGGGHRQVPVAFLLRKSTVVDLTHRVAHVLGRMLGAARQSDPIDAHIVFLARERGWPVLTSDPEDLLAIDPTLMVERI